MEYLAEHHRHAIGMRSRREESKVLAFPVEQENERGMVDGVAFALRHLLVEHLVARRNAAAYSRSTSGRSRSGSRVTKSGCTASASAPSSRNACPMRARSVGQTSG